MKTALLLILNFYCALVLIAQDAHFIISAPAGDKITKIEIGGSTVIPNGRFLTQIGKSYIIAPHPYGLVLSND